MCETIATYFIMLGIYLFVSKMICAKSLKSKKVYAPVLFCISAVTGLILLLIFGVALTAVKGMILTQILLYASLSDLEMRKVSDSVSIMILILSFVGFDATYLPSMLIGAAIVFIPQLALAIIRPNRACGGADIKISSALAFMLGAEKGVLALIIGMLLAVIVMTIYYKVQKTKQKEAFPLVPFLSIGGILAFLI